MHPIRLPRALREFLALEALDPAAWAEVQKILALSFGPPLPSDPPRPVAPCDLDAEH